MPSEFEQTLKALRGSQYEILVKAFRKRFVSIPAWRMYLIALFQQHANSCQDAIYLHSIFNRVPADKIRLLSRGSIINLVSSHVPFSNGTAIALKNASCMKGEMEAYWFDKNRKKLLEMRIGLNMKAASVMVSGWNQNIVVLNQPIMETFFGLKIEDFTKIWNNYRSYLVWEKRFLKEFPGENDWWLVPLLMDAWKLGFDKFKSLVGIQLEEIPYAHAK